MTCALVAQGSSSSNEDHFTDSYGFDNTVKDALYNCYNDTKELAEKKYSRQQDPYKFYWNCLFEYGVVI